MATVRMEKTVTAYFKTVVLQDTVTKKNYKLVVANGILEIVEVA